MPSVKLSKRINPLLGTTIHTALSCKEVTGLHHSLMADIKYWICVKAESMQWTHLSMPSMMWRVAAPAALPASKLHRMSCSGVSSQILLGLLSSAVHAEQLGPPVRIRQQCCHLRHQASQSQRHNQLMIRRGADATLQEAAGLCPELVQLLLAQLRLDPLHERLRFRRSLRS